jgi:hypothetical protein
VGLFFALLARCTCRACMLAWMRAGANLHVSNACTQVPFSFVLSAPRCAARGFARCCGSPGELVLCGDWLRPRVWLRRMLHKMRSEGEHETCRRMGDALCVPCVYCVWELRVWTVESDVDKVFRESAITTIDTGSSTD